MTTNGDQQTLILNRLVEQLATNAFLARRDLFQRLVDPRRDIDAECGYPKTSELHTHYQEAFDRGDIAARVVGCWPEDVWRVNPSVYEVEDSDEATPFEEAFDALGKQLRGRSWLLGDDSHPLWDYAKRAHILSRSGRYSVALVGTDDGLPLDQPARGVQEANSAPAGKGVPAPSANGAYRLTVNAAETAGRKLLYLSVFPEAQAEVSTWETNPSSPRYRQPVTYTLTFDDPSSLWQGGSTGSTRQVHWTRVVHVAVDVLGCDWLAVPAMQACFNRLYDLRKVYGASGEAFWQNAIMKLFFELLPSLAGKADVDQASMKAEYEKLIRGLQPGMVLENFSAKTVAPSVVDPGPHAEALITAICVAINYPKRRFMGSEQGELASSEDTKRHNANVRGYQTGRVTARLVAPLIDRFIMLGVLPEPEPREVDVGGQTVTRQGYHVDWPDVTAQSETEKATVFQQRMAGLSAYVSGGVEALIPPREMLTLEAGYTDEEADQVLEAAQVHEEEQLAERQDQIDAGLVPDPQAQQPDGQQQGQANGEPAVVGGTGP